MNYECSKYFVVVISVGNVSEHRPTDDDTDSMRMANNDVDCVLTAGVNAVCKQVAGDDFDSALITDDHDVDRMLIVGVDAGNIQVANDDTDCADHKN